MTTDLRSLLRDKGLNAARLARILNVDKATTSRWVTRRVPADRVPEVERATGIPRSALRPDLFAVEKKRGAQFAEPQANFSAPADAEAAE